MIGRRFTRRRKHQPERRLERRLVFVCQTETNVYTKRVLASIDSPECRPTSIHETKDYLEYWVGHIIRGGETLVRWWVEDENGSMIEDFGTDLSVYVNEYGKLRKRR